MQDKRECAPKPAPAQTPMPPMEACQTRRADTRDTLHALAKDVHSVTAHSQVLQDNSRRTLEAVRATRARSRLLERPQDLRMTVPEACRIVGVCERTLRLTLREPEIAERAQEGTRKVGTFYKTVPLLPPDLVDDLHLRFAQKKKRSQVVE